MTTPVKPPEYSYLAVRIPNKNHSTRTMCKVASCVGIIFGTLGIGIGIGYLIANKTLETLADPYADYYPRFCVPLFKFMGCLDRAFPNSFNTLQAHQCFTPDYCDP